MTGLLDWLAGDLPEPVRTSWLLVLGFWVVAFVFSGSLLTAVLIADWRRRRWEHAERLRQRVQRYGGRP